jgi:hypothetical protein
MLLVAADHFYHCFLFAIDDSSFVLSVYDDPSHPTTCFCIADSKSVPFVFCLTLPSLPPPPALLLGV